MYVNYVSRCDGKRENLFKKDIRIELLGGFRSRNFQLLRSCNFILLDKNSLKFIKKYDCVYIRQLC